MRVDILRASIADRGYGCSLLGGDDGGEKNEQMGRQLGDVPVEELDGLVRGRWGVGERESEVGEDGGGVERSEDGRGGGLGGGGHGGSEEAPPEPRTPPRDGVKSSLSEDAAADETRARNASALPYVATAMSTDAVPAILESPVPDPTELILLIFIHGSVAATTLSPASSAHASVSRFKGDDATFGEFPQRLQHNIGQTVEYATVESIVFPAYEVCLLPYRRAPLLSCLHRSLD